MKKDVIYVDIEDDITSIIEKVKGASSKIVALVPPKRIGALQSVVNLKLLQRAAATADKRVVLITNNQALTGLAAGVAIPIAKNLQSKPELVPAAAAVVDEDDVIDGDDLPVGEAAEIAPTGAQAPARSFGKAAIQPRQGVNPAPKTGAAAGATASAAGASAAATVKPPKKSLKVPNFDSFRKKIFLLGGLGLALAAFFVWALAFAPNATINISAITSPYDVKKPLNLAVNQALDADAGTLAAVVQEIQKTNTVDFTPTGKKEVGEAAKGTLTLTNNTESDPVAVPAGASFTTQNGLRFVADVAATVPGANPPFSGGVSSKPGVTTVAVTASAIGENYNIGAQANVVSNDVTVKAEFKTATSGGSKREVTVVSDDDVAKAKEKLAAVSADAVKEELRMQFKDDTIAVLESFVVTAGQPSVSPAVGQEATAAKLTAETKYSMIGAPKADLEKVLEADIVKQLKDLPNQKVYESGVNDVRFADFAPAGDGAYAVTVTTTGFVGPAIESETIAARATGKRAGEIQASIQAIEGVESVDVQLAPFWVTQAPAKEKITVKFLVNNETN